MRPILPILLLFFAGFFVHGCGGDDPVAPDVPDFEYLAYADADSAVALANLVENLRQAWENRDIAEYRDEILYDGVAAAADGQVYAGFTFYFDPAGADPGQQLPETDDHSSELARVGRMFAGLEGEDPNQNTVPGIRSIAMGLNPEGLWAAPSGGSVEGDAFPAGTREGYFETDILFQLVGVYEEQFVAFQIRDRARFHLIPVDAGAGLVRYRLWKWRDIISLYRLTDDTTFSSVKALY